MSVIWLILFFSFSKPIEGVTEYPTWLQSHHKEFLASDPSVLRSKADVVVAKDETGNYKSVSEAIASAPEYSKTQYVIYVKRGTYDEILRIGENKPRLTLVGDGSDATILTGSLNAKDGVTTFDTATLGVKGEGFIAQDLRIQNTAGPEKDQAVALRISADSSVVYRCHIEGFQDTLYAESKRQFYRECYITGTVDFICGRALAVFQYCQIEARKPLHGQSNMVTAQSRQDLGDKSGFSIQRCHITASADLLAVKRDVKTFLGRPWKKFSTVVVMQSYIEDVIDPAGWAPWNNSDFALSTLYYGEYENRGPGSVTTKRVQWKGHKIIKNPEEAAAFTVTNLLQGNLWLNNSGVPYDGGL